MSKIENKASQQGEMVTRLRNAYGHRAGWMGNLLAEAEKGGVDQEKAGRPAIYKYGCIQGADLKADMKDPTDMVEFANTFAVGTDRLIFDMEVVAADEDKYYLDFHYCPLVDGWKKQGFSDEEIDKLCDIAMDGDRGIASNFDAFTFTLGETIAQGKPCCQIRFDKKK